MMETVATTSNGKILRTFLTPNAHTRGFRAGVDVAVDSGQSTDLRVFLRVGLEGAHRNLDLPLAGLRGGYGAGAAIAKSRSAAFAGRRIGREPARRP